MHRGGTCAHTGVPRLAAWLLPLLFCLLVAAALVDGATADATTTTPSVAGSWSCCGAGGAAEQSFAITESGGSLSGTASTSGGPFSPISGSISGTSVTIVTGPYTTDPGYTATFLGTLSANGESMSGTWSSNVGQSGTWSATRTSGSPTTTIETTQEKETKAKAVKAKEEAEAKAKEAKEKEEAAKKKPKGTQPTTMIVFCNQEMPDTPNAFFECTVEVINRSLSEPLAVPSGSVSFAVNPGGSGGFRGSNVCNLKASELGSNSSFCSIIYLAVPPGSIPIGSQPPITGTYSGDNVFASNSAQPRSPLPSVPQVSAQASGSSTSLPMTCPSGVICTGAVQMTSSGTQTSAKGSAVAAATVLVASGRYSIHAHKTAKVKLRLSKRGKALLKKYHHHLVLTLEIKPKTGAPISKALVLK